MREHLLMRPPGTVEHQLAIDGGRVRILSSDVEPDGVAPLLLLPGGNDSAAVSFYELFATLGTERRLLGLDLPGFGDTTGLAPLGGAIEMADFVARVCDELALTRVVLVGVAMGGDVALNTALGHPALVESLVLVAPGGLVPVFRNRALQLTAWLTAQLPDRVLEGLSDLANRRVRAALRAMVKRPDRLPPPVLAEFARLARRPGAGMGYLRYHQASLGPWSMRNDLLPEVHRIGAPTLFFHGADDPLVDPAGSIEACRRMPDARLVLVPDCRHWAQLEAPERFLTEVRRFLATA